MGGENKALKRLDNNTLAFLELENNGVDAVVADIAIVREYVKNNPNKKFTRFLIRKTLNPNTMAFCFLKAATLKQSLIRRLRKLSRTGICDSVQKMVRSRAGYEEITRTKIIGQEHA